MCSCNVGAHGPFEKEIPYFRTILLANRIPHGAIVSNTISAPEKRSAIMVKKSADPFPQKIHQHASDKEQDSILWTFNIIEKAFVEQECTFSLLLSRVT